MNKFILIVVLSFIASLSYSQTIDSTQIGKEYPYILLGVFIYSHDFFGHKNWKKIQKYSCEIYQFLNLENYYIVKIKTRFMK